MDYSLFLAVHEVPRVAEIRDFDLQFFVQKDILSFYIAVSNALAVQEMDSLHQLLENILCSFFSEGLGLGNNAEELPIFGDFHDIVLDVCFLALNGSLHPKDIEI